MSGPGSLKRDPSYRKPVPVFLPSPPPSPPSASPQPRPLSFSMESVMNNVLPPLPEGWRDAIDRAVSRGMAAFDNEVIDVEALGDDRPLSSCSTLRSETGSALSSVYEECDNDRVPVTPPMSPVPWVQSPRVTRKRTLPPTYRPPTPPIPAYLKNKRLPEDESSSSLALPMYFHMLYPDPPSVVDLSAGRPDEKTNLESCRTRRREWNSMPSTTSEANYATWTSSRAAATARADPSTENEARESWARDTWYILRKSEYQDGMSDEKHLYYEESIAHTSSFWERLTMLGNQLKSRMRNIRTVAFPICD